MAGYSPNGRFLAQETFPKTLPRFVLILISLQRWQHRVRNETKHFVSPHLIGPQFLANRHETNQHKSAALIGLFHATSSVLLSVESYRNYRKPTQRGVQGYLSSLQWRVTAGQLNIKLLVDGVHNLRVLLIFFDFILFISCFLQFSGAGIHFKKCCFA